MMRGYTTVEQSKKLADILPIDTADCCYIKYCTSDNMEWRYDGQPPIVLGEIPITEITAEHIPCWSLAALLQIMPKYIEGLNRLRIDIDDVDFSIWYDDMEGYGVNDKLPDITLKEPIDACYEMILKLKEMNLL